MHTQYGLPIAKHMFDELKRWNRIDPPSKQEILRNNIIEELQGNRNKFIDNSSLVERISLKLLMQE